MPEDLETRQRRWKEQFDQARNKIWAAASRPDTTPDVPARPNPLKLYHYTSMAAITGILSHREIWLSDILAMNDTRDGRYWIEVFRRFVVRSSVPKYVQELFKRSATFGLGELWHEYVACFSERPDLESQWEQYADGGRGCAIEISFDALRAVSSGGKTYAYMSMLYCRDRQDKIAKQMIASAIYLARAENLASADTRLFWTRHATWNFLVCGTQFKDPSYRSEQEWRVSISRPDRQGVRYRASASGSQIAYLSQPLDSTLVTGLVKGPRCVCRDDELSDLLARNGFPPRILSFPSIS